MMTCKTNFIHLYTKLKIIDYLMSKSTAVLTGSHLTGLALGVVHGSSGRGSRASVLFMVLDEKV